MRALTFGFLLLLGGCSGCDGKPATQPKRAPLPGDVLLAVDGIEFTFGDVQPFLDFYDRLFPEWGKQTKMRQILTSYLVPLKFARRDFFPAERAPRLEAARALRQVADNARELEARSTSLTRFRQTVIVQQVDLPVAMFLFDSSRVGAVSQPIEVPQGWTVATALDLKESNGHSGGAVGDDLCDALLVGFYVADKTAWEPWLAHLRTDLANKKATFVHPDFRDAIPEYLLR